MDGNAFATFVAGSRWQFAKTMANIPHAYTRRVWCDDKAFEDAVIFHPRKRIPGRILFEGLSLLRFRLISILDNRRPGW